MNIFFLYIINYYYSTNPPSPIAQSVALRTWEQEVAGSIPGSAITLS